MAPDRKRSGPVERGREERLNVPFLCERRTMTGHLGNRLSACPGMGSSGQTCTDLHVKVQVWAAMDGHCESASIRRAP